MHSQAAAAASDRSATSASRHADYDGILSVADESGSVESQRLRSAVDIDTIAAPAGHDYATESPRPSEPSESSCLLPKATAMKHNPTNFREQFRNRSALVDLLVIFFGIGAWIGVNSNFVQLPLLVVHAPEGWNLPSYMVIVTQLGNIGPLLYTVLQRWKSFPDSYMIYAVLIVGTLGSICMAFLYETTAFVFGAERSVAMLVCVFALALVGCTSSVLFMPYMGRFRDIYLITYIIGEGLSGFLPSIVALIQGVGGNAQCIAVNGTDQDNPQFVSYTPPPRFGSMEYFIFVFVVLIFSTVAFVVLDKYPRCRAEYASVVIKNGNDYTYEPSQPTASTSSPSSTEVKIISNRNYVYLMILLGLLCMFGNGIFPSVQSYSCLPYGNIAYHLTVTLSTMANPVACFMAVFLPHTSIRAISTISLLAAAFTVYALATAFLSPAPPLVGKAIGDALVIITWTIVVGLVSYVRLSITTVFRYQGGKSLVWAGGVTQIGSLIGSVLSFGLINFTDLFQPYYPC